MELIWGCYRVAVGVLGACQGPLMGLCMGLLWVCYGPAMTCYGPETDQMLPKLLGISGVIIL